MCGPPSPAANCPGERVEGNRTLPLISLGVVDGDWVYPIAHPSCTPLKLGREVAATGRTGIGRVARRTS